MNTVSNTLFTTTYPNSMFETRGRFAYVKVQLLAPKENVDVTLDIGNLGNAEKAKLIRKTDTNGIVVFPIGPICESMINPITLGVTVLEKYQGFSNIYHIDGYAKGEIAQGFTDETFYPAAPCIVVYPNLGMPQPMFFPYTREFFVISKSGVDLGYTSEGPIVEFEASKIPQQDLGENIGVGINPDIIDLEIKTYYDYCTSGVFLKWTDAAGVPYLYRWTQEAETDDMSVSSTYRQLDDTLTPYDVQTKTLTTRHTLHSRIVERDIFNMCRTIIGCQELFMYDPDISEWVRCTIEDGEVEDTGAPMQDLQIEVVKYEYL